MSKDKIQSFLLLFTYQHSIIFSLSKLLSNKTKNFGLKKIGHLFQGKVFEKYHNYTYNAIKGCIIKDFRYLKS